MGRVRVACCGSPRDSMSSGAIHTEGSHEHWHRHWHSLTLSPLNFTTARISQSKCHLQSYRYFQDLVIMYSHALPAARKQVTRDHNLTLSSSKLYHCKNFEEQMSPPKLPSFSGLSYNGWSRVTNSNETSNPSRGLCHGATVFIHW